MANLSGAAMIEDVVRHVRKDCWRLEIDGVNVLNMADWSPGGKKSHAETRKEQRLIGDLISNEATRQRVLANAKRVVLVPDTETATKQYDRQPNGTYSYSEVHRA